MSVLFFVIFVSFVVKKDCSQDSEGVETVAFWSALES